MDVTATQPHDCNCTHDNCPHDPLFMGEPEAGGAVKQEEIKEELVDYPSGAGDQLMAPEYILPHDPPGIKLEPEESPFPGETEFPDVGNSSAPTGDLCDEFVLTALRAIQMDHDYVEQVASSGARLAYQHETSDAPTCAGTLEVVKPDHDFAQESYSHDATQPVPSTSSGGGAAGTRHVLAVRRQQRPGGSGSFVLCFVAVMVVIRPR